MQPILSHKRKASPKLGRAPVVIVVQEIFGLTDWIRGVADQLAKEGFIAIAPDFMSVNAFSVMTTESVPNIRS